jgi:AcrR family transcriptional regulator
MVVLDSVGETLLKAAGDLLASEGSAALTVRRIAAEAGVSTMNVYSRFGGKDGVVEHLYIEGFRRLGEGMDAGAATADSVADMRLCGLAYRHFATENPTLYSVMFDRAVPDYEPSDEALVYASATLGLLASRLERAMAAGRLQPSDPLETAALVWATCHGVVSLERNNVGPPTIDWHTVYAHALDMIMRGLAA